MKFPSSSFSPFETHWMFHARGTAREEREERRWRRWQQETLQLLYDQRMWESWGNGERKSPWQERDRRLAANGQNGHLYPRATYTYDVARAWPSLFRAHTNLSDQWDSVRNKEVGLEWSVYDSTVTLSILNAKRRGRGRTLGSHSVDMTWMRTDNSQTQSIHGTHSDKRRRERISKW